jgi:hypothetical protein
MLVEVVVVVVALGAVRVKIRDAVVAHDRVVHRHVARPVLDVGVCSQRAQHLVFGARDHRRGERRKSAHVSRLLVGAQRCHEALFVGIGRPHFLEQVAVGILGPAIGGEPPVELFHHAVEAERLSVDAHHGPAGSRCDHARRAVQIVGQSLLHTTVVEAIRVEVQALQPEKTLIVHELVELQLHAQAVAHEGSRFVEAVVESAVGALEA